MNKEVIDKIDEIIKYIKKSKNYKKYLMIEKQLSNNEDILALIKNIKFLQKQAVQQQYLNNHNKVKVIDRKISDDLNKLNSIPLYIEYTNVVEELNNLLTNIKNIVELYINEKTE